MLEGRVEGGSIFGCISVRSFSHWDPNAYAGGGAFWVMYMRWVDFTLEHVIETPSGSESLRENEKTYNKIL